MKIPFILAYHQNRNRVDAQVTVRAERGHGLRERKQRLLKPLTPNTTKQRLFPISRTLAPPAMELYLEWIDGTVHGPCFFYRFIVLLEDVWSYAYLQTQ